ncbi:MAG TPA: ABC transporter ATP-binding protein [Clostridia bacterium]|nr:ABC transporter ATP-binding protein [Clostridia bacterium]
MVEQKTGHISAENLRKIFEQPDGQILEALNDVNVDIKPGEFVSLIGPSGCGKSTFLRLLAGLIQPDDGRFTLDDVAIKKPSYERGLVFQDPTLFPWLTVYENVAFGLKIRNIYKEKRPEVSDFIKLVGLSGFEKAYPHQLSGGMAQRASLARALVNHPKVLLLDEPFGALDAFTRMNMQDELIKIWQRRGTTMVMVTHDVDEAIYLSDRIIVMTSRPAKIESIIDVKISRPRERDLPDFLYLRSKILQILDFAGKKEELQYYL